jgi:hemerythrin superfamily protein
MDAIELLEVQHREVESLFGKLQSDRLRRDEKLGLFRELADALAIHSSIEENHFYPLVRTSDTEDLLMESLEEHLAMKRLLADLMKMPIDEAEFDAKLTVLEEQVDQHVKKERKELFPRVRNLLDADQLEAIGQLMTATAADLEGRAPRLDVPLQTMESAPLKTPAEGARPMSSMNRFFTPLENLFNAARNVMKGIGELFRPPRRPRTA